MAGWQAINKLIFEAGKCHQPAKLAQSVFCHLHWVINFDRLTFVTLSTEGEVQAIKKSGRPSPQMVSQTDDSCLLSISRQYYQNYPPIEKCLLDSRDGEVPKLQKLLGIRQALGGGLWDPAGHLRCIYSMELLKSNFRHSDLQTDQLVFRQLNNLYQNLLLTPRWKKPIASKLTQREQEVARLLMTGLPPEKVADRLGITMGTLTKHIAHLHRKLDVHNQQELMVKLFQVFEHF